MTFEERKALEEYKAEADLENQRVTMKIQIPEEDLEFIDTQTAIVMRLWHQCWRSDPYGSSWKVLNHNLSDRAFRRAKKILWDVGLFAFRPDKSTVDARKTVHWEILNLHGSRSSRRNNYWMKYITDSESNQNQEETDQVL